MIVYYSNMINWPLERITQQFQDLQKAGASLVRIMGIQRIQGKIPGEDNFIHACRTAAPPGHRWGWLLRRSPLVMATASRHAPKKVEALPAADPEPEVDLEDQRDGFVQHRFPPEAGQDPRSAGTHRQRKNHHDPPALPPVRSGRGMHPPGRDGHLLDITQLPPQELRRSVGMVTQNIQLFHATVRENLTFFDDSIPDEQILEAIQDLGLWDWFSSLPKGLDTELESGGGGLSAGEAQLLAFTRIFLRDPGLVILDEATSRLDPATEHLIEQAVDKLVQNRTAIIVAHRLGTVERADDILILEDGEICEFGERLQLVGDPDSRFYHLLETGLEEVLA